VSSAGVAVNLTNAITSLNAAGFGLVNQRIQGFFVLPVAGDTAVLGGLAGFGIVEGFDGEGEG